MKHIHAELMRQYAEDAMETEKPWKRWEQLAGYISNDSEWITLSGSPTWNKKFLFRRKPKTININGYEVPEPQREPLRRGDKYYLVDITEKTITLFRWLNDEADNRWLNQGLIHLIKKSAELHKKAIISFTIKDTK